MSGPVPGPSRRRDSKRRGHRQFRHEAGRRATMTRAQPRVLLIYYTFSRQTERVGGVIARTLEARGADVTMARIELTDERWAKRFAKVPMRFPLIQLVGMLPAQVRQATGEIRDPARGEGGSLRPRGDRLANVVVPPEPADALLPHLRLGQDGAPGNAVRRVLDVPSLLEAQRRRHQATRTGQRREVDRPDALRRGRQPGPVDARLAQLHVRLHVFRQAAPPATDEPATGIRGPGAAVCRAGCGCGPRRRAERRRDPR